MKTMKVLKPFGPQDLRIVSVPIPEPGPGQVRIKIRASGICGSDKWVWYVENKVDAVAGHEVAGDVDKLGEGVHSLVQGDRVAINNVGGCGGCPACRGGAFVHCPHWDGSRDVNNGFGEYLIAPACNCMRLLPSLDYVEGALVIDNWGTPYGGLLRGQVTSNMDVIVNGCGPIGQAAIALCKAKGAYVIAIDPIKWRRDLALKNGANKALSPNDLLSETYKLTNGVGADVLLECSGVGSSYDTSLKSLRVGGTLVAIGEGANININSSDQIIRRSLSIVGTWYSTMPNANKVMQLAAQGQINLKCFLTHVVTLEDVPQLFESIIGCDDGILKCVVVFD